MYQLSSFEFTQYESAERRYQELRIKHANEIQRLYDNIHPTRSGFDYDLGEIHSESINTEDYAIYLIELKQEHEQSERWWALRAKAYSEAYGKLTSEEQRCLNFHEYGQYQERRVVWNRLREILAEIIESRPELKRKSVSLDEIEDMDEADNRIEQMSKKELLKDYWDLDELLNGERIKKQCISLYEIHELPIFMIAKKLGIQVSKVKEYVKSIPLKPVSLKPIEDNTEFTKKVGVNGLTISYLSSEELEEYRSGKKGGSKWCSYNDYKEMKKSGMTHKEIALKLGIESSMLSKRVNAWRNSRFNRSLF